MDFAEFTTRCDALLVALRDVCDATMADRVDAARSRLQAETLKILVVGEFSRGKSTFINALAGAPLLPSKVNPTTATINVLRGGHPAQAVVEYLDGHQETMALPEVGVNKFLDSVVTTANERAQSIRTVNIVVPGRLEALQADIVDTPGVNDLDQAREETTFGYLRQADAAVMLLDAQQPLSESERSFLKEKVFGSDIRNILFVVNKIDEVDSDANIARIVTYVRERLTEFLGLDTPVVHAVSSKEALRARFRGEPDPARFLAFEDHLLAFAGAHATGGRLRIHLERVASLLRDQQTLLETRAKVLARELDDVDRELSALADAQRLLHARETRLEARLASVGLEVSQSVSSACRGEVARFRAAMAERLRACKTDDDIDQFRQHLSSALRELVTKVEASAAAAGDAARLGLEQDFSEVLGTSSVLTRPGGASGVQLYLDARPAEGTRLDVPRAEGPVDLSDAAIGAGLGWVGASMFGPVGVAAAIVGTYVIGKARRDREAAEFAQREREAMLASLHTSCDQLADRAVATGDEVARRESERLGEHLRERFQTQKTLITVSQDSTRATQSQGKAERAALRNDVLGSLDKITTIQRDVRALERESTHAPA